jgi:hypothetical protein
MRMSITSVIIRLASGRRNPLLRIENRNVLWDWIPPYALLAERAPCTEWQPLLAALRTHFEEKHLG